jgi:hypothetical protein
MMHATKTTIEQLSHERFILFPYENAMRLEKPSRRPSIIGGAHGA